ncbi:MAG: serine acetyltransferase [Cyanobium sp. CACIAM 14]|nr:MAG: serine acetyltransferase [Cyanobium sp. CACIAM 14]
MSGRKVSPPPPESRQVQEEGWNLAAIVASLRGIREHSHLEWRHPHALVQLPSRKALGQALEGLCASLYPHRLGLPEPDLFGFPTPLSATDYFVGHTLDASLRSLRDQIRIELLAREPARTSDRQMLHQESRATRIVGGFASQLPFIRSLLDTDLQAAFTGDPAAGSIDEVLVCYPGVKAIMYHRFAHALHGLGCPVVARIIAEISHSATGVDIHPGAEIGESFFIDHGSGVVIGGTAVIGSRVRLYQAVTLGAKHFPVDADGQLVKGEPRHPIVEDDVVIYAGATILGRVTIGRGSTIGGNVWLTRSIPAGTTITQARARNETFNDGAGI